MSKFLFKSPRGQWVNSLGPRRCGCNLKFIFFKLLPRIDILSIFCEIDCRWMPPDVTNDESTLVQVIIPGGHQATSHYLNQCWPSSMKTYGHTGSQWVKYCHCMNTVAQWRHMASEILVNSGSVYALLPDGTKALLEPMLTYHRRCSLWHSPESDFTRSACELKSLAPVRSEWNFRYVICKLISVIDGRGSFGEIAVRWMLLDLNDDKSTLVQVMAWCHQATSHYLSQWWPRSMSPYGVTRPQWVKIPIVWGWLTFRDTASERPWPGGAAPPGNLSAPPRKFSPYTFPGYFKHPTNSLISYLELHCSSCYAPNHQVLNIPHKNNNVSKTESGRMPKLGGRWKWRWKWPKGPERSN